jgi:drug/metabolite transporter (DMT)-like permease
MLAAPRIAAPGYALAAVAAWGTSDFLGGYFTRRAHAFLFTTIVNAGGLCLMLALALARHATVPATRSIVWAIVAGAAGGASLAVFYRALSSGKMGLTAPVSAVLSAAIPTIFSIFTEGFPGPLAILGFVFAVIGLWLITRAEDGGTPEGIGLAVFAGFGFAGFYLCIRQAGAGSPFWFATLSRLGGLLVTGLIVLVLQLRSVGMKSSGLGWGVLIGGIDSLGTILFVLSSQAGRLDEAVVISSLYPAVTVLLARIMLKEHLPMIAAG